MVIKICQFVWRAVAPLNFELGIKVGGVLESSGSQLENAYNSFSVAFNPQEIFEFKVDCRQRKCYTYTKSSEKAYTFMSSSLL